MKPFHEIIKIAINTLMIEANTIKHLGDFIDEDFAKITQLILNSKGKVVITGIGKSAIIANKIVATFISTGTPSTFMHAADAIHGDLGMIQPEDIVICISKSGNTPEIKVLVPLVKKLGGYLVGICAEKKSFLGKNADFLIYTPIEKEACPNNLAPTSSTIAQMAIGDALAVCLMECRGFSGNDFAKFHPGGALGKKLYVKAKDLIDLDRVPKVEATAGIKEVIIEISSKRLGATAVLKDGDFIGIITDGDLRRMMEQEDGFSNKNAMDIMTKNPKVLQASDLAVNAFSVMEEYKITQLPVMEKGKYIGIIHLHDVLNAGIF